MNETASTGRPRRTMRILPRLGMLLVLVLALGQGSVQLASSQFLQIGPGAALRPLMSAVLIRYWPIRVWAVHNSSQALVVVGCTAAALLIAARYLLLLWHNQMHASTSSAAALEEATRGSTS
jgi:hypothetical protein